jgi:hypothetical protein
MVRGERRGACAEGQSGCGRTHLWRGLCGPRQSLQRLRRRSPRLRWTQKELTRSPAAHAVVRQGARAPSWARGLMACSPTAGGKTKADRQSPLRLSRAQMARSPSRRRCGGGRKPRRLVRHAARQIAALYQRATALAALRRVAGRLDGAVRVWRGPARANRRRTTPSCPCSIRERTTKAVRPGCGRRGRERRRPRCRGGGVEGCTEFCFRRSI